MVNAMGTLGAEIAITHRKGFLFDPQFALPKRVEALSRAGEGGGGEADADLAFLHPRLYGELQAGVKAGLLTWESSVMPAAWSADVEKHLDMLFVPSPFVAEAARQGGVRDVSIEEVPYGVDRDVFHPGVHGFSEAELFAQGAALLGGKAPDGLSDRFVLLTVGAPHHRKGLLEVARAYVHAFCRRNRVLLVVKTTYLPGEGGGRVRDFEVPQLARTLGEIVAGTGLPLLLLSGTLTDLDQARLYRSADVYVCASYGEGFGLSVLEAKACGVPVAAAIWGGLASFCTEADTWPVPFVLEDAGRNQYDEAATAQVARPDVESLGEIMRSAYRVSSGERKRRVERSLEVAKRFTWLRSASGVLSGIEKCMKTR